MSKRIDDSVKFNVSEIFFSIQGEGTRSGLPCVFVRMQGCNLRCKWCDTGYALQIGKQANIMVQSEIIKAIEDFGCNFVEFTGGEPLLQPATLPLMSELCDMGYIVAVETGGSLNAANVDLRVIRIIDVKCPASASSELNDYSNLYAARRTDEIKFVIANQEDYVWAKNINDKYNLTERVNCVLFSPSFKELPPAQLAEWILRDNLKVRMQIQIHKYIWDPNKRGV